MSDSLSPWDAAPFFQQPVEATFPLSSSPTRVAQGDPTRVCIVFSATASGAQINLSTSSSVTASTGILLTNTFPIILTFRDHGPLVWNDWYAVGGLAGSLVVMTVSMSRWPEQDQGADYTLLQAIGHLSSLIRELTNAIRS